MTIRPLFAALAAAALLVGCSTGAGSNAQAAAQSARSVHPQSGLAVIPLTITHAGQRAVFRVEVAATAEEQDKGLMFRTKMGADEGMLFPLDPARTASFWMRNTVLPLDLIFVAPDGRIANIAANAVPYDEAHLESKGVVKAVLELNGGRAAQLGIAPGDRVSW